MALVARISARSGPRTGGSELPKGFNVGICLQSLKSNADSNSGFGYLLKIKNFWKLWKAYGLLVASPLCASVSPLSSP